MLQVVCLAVKEDLKIAQLFEYYMMTVDDKYLDRQFPKSVLLYFRHGNTLEYKKAAVLYANLINCEEESSELYSAYREQMERFAGCSLRIEGSMIFCILFTNAAVLSGI